MIHKTTLEYVHYKDLIGKLLNLLKALYCLIEWVTDMFVAFGFESKMCIVKVSFTLSQIANTLLSFSSTHISISWSISRTHFYIFKVWHLHYNLLQTRFVVNIIYPNISCFVMFVIIRSYFLGLIRMFLRLCSFFSEPNYYIYSELSIINVERIKSHQMY